MYYSIDRFEDDIAVLQDDGGNSRDVPRSLLPGGSKQGDILIFEDGGWLHDPDETARRKERVKRLQERLLKKRK